MNAAATETQANCLRCGRTLTSAASITAGYGPTCRAKVAAGANAADLTDFKPAQVTSALELIEDGAILPIRTGIYRSVSTDGTELYLTAVTGQCNCPAGLRSTRCYHAAAARILAPAA